MQAIYEFSEKVKQVTGRDVRDSEVADFIERMENATAHNMPRIVQRGFCDFQTISGRAELVEVAF